MSYLENLKREANYITTLNGAKTHGTTGDACLDFFAVAGGMRYRKKQDQIRLFSKAYIENPELAMKLLFYIRDIRQGMGERQMFRTLIQYVATNWPESVKKNVHLIAEFGRWDDLLCLLETSAKKVAVDVIREQLEKDLDAVRQREAGNLKAPVSLLGKWMPSSNTSSQRTRRYARILMQELNMNERTYRKMLAKLRANSCVTEKYLSNKKMEKINYEAVPAGAMLKYRQSFRCNDQERFEAYIAEVSCGEKNIHCDTLFPYELVRPYFQMEKGSFWNCGKVIDAKGMNVLDTMWNNRKLEIANQNAISVIDTSGSMFCQHGDGPLPILLSISLGMYYAERCKGVFHNHFITFESNPHLMEIHGTTLRDKLSYIATAPWGGSTNLEAVFELILRTAVNAGASQDEMPSVLYIISDMEFNVACRNGNKTVYENAKERFEAFGYQMPAVVFQNVNSWQMQTPVTAHTQGTALTSGASTAAFTQKFDGNVTPMSHMLKVLNSERYKEVHA